MAQKRKNEIPVDVYIPFVETLFRDALTLVDRRLLPDAAGRSWSTGRPTIRSTLRWPPDALLVGMSLRMRSIRKYRHVAVAQDWEEARRRENDYIFYGSHAGLHRSACSASSASTWRMTTSPRSPPSA